MQRKSTGNQPTAWPPDRPTARPPIMRDVRPVDIPRLRWLNTAAVPAVNEVPEEFLYGFIDAAMYYRVVGVDDVIEGFLMVLGPGHDYHSPSYQFFSARHPDFAYVDRIVINQSVRGRGFGRMLYEDLFRTVRGRDLVVCCEVNLQPPNPVSLAFHRQMGFREVGRQKTDEGRKEVVLLEAGGHAVGRSGG